MTYGETGVLRSPQSPQKMVIYGSWSSIRGAHHIANRLSLPTPRCHALPLRGRISSSCTTFDWLQNILFRHVQGVIIL